MKVILKGSLAFDGVSTFLFNYLKKIPLENHQVDFIARSDTNLRSDFLEFIDLNKGLVFYYDSLKNNGFRYLSLLCKIFKKNKYDVYYINANSSLAILDVIIAKLFRIKRIIVHSHNSKTKHKLLHKILKPFMNFLSIDRIACSDTAAEWLFGKKKYIFMPNSIDYSRFKYNYNNRLAVRKKLNINDEFIIGNVGFFSEIKNQSFILDFFKDFIEHDKNVKLVLISGNKPPKEILTKIEMYGLKKSVILLQNIIDINKYYSFFDVFVLPSLHEGLPLTLIEAQVSGLKCIISNNITKEVEISRNLRRCNINSGTEHWVREIEKIKDLGNYDRASIFDKLTDNFNIEIQSNKFYDVLFRENI